MKVNILIGVIAILWVGMILAIGMESIVKFNTPTLTKAIGFDVGRTVFAAFNKIQLGLLMLLLIMIFFADLTLFSKLLFGVIALTLCLQSFWLFPVLAKRVDLILSGIKPPVTYIHGLYGMLELLKLASLLTLGMILLVKS